ncbi:MAG: ACT domain-containing protein [Candidatus Methanomethylophilaceae archaeon]|jgi:ACT domain-containing protein|nr:ACT domain-containing protein [Candidatus Methanomethylophilaceae archaeon]
MDRLIVTLVGRDTVGIIAKVCTYFANNRINILDIAQTTVRDIINMVMIVDIEPSELGFEDVRKTIASVSKDVKCIINVVRDADLDEI